MDVPWRVGSASESRPGSGSSKDNGSVNAPSALTSPVADGSTTRPPMLPSGPRATTRAPLNVEAPLLLMWAAPLVRSAAAPTQANCGQIASAGLRDAVWVRWSGQGSEVAKATLGRN